MDYTQLGIVVGQIAALGILLTFYQFVDSLHTDDYLGIKVSGVYYRNDFLERIISSKIFFITFAFEIICIPAKCILSYCDYDEADRIFDAYFGVVSILFFLLFSLLFWKCAILMIGRKSMPEEQIRGNVIKRINNSLIKEGRYNLKFKKNYDVLKDACVLIVAKHDGKKSDIGYYYELMLNLFDETIRCLYYKKNVKWSKNKHIFWKKEDSILEALDIALRNKNVFDERLTLFLLHLYIKFLKCFFDEKLDQGGSELSYFEEVYGLYLGKDRKVYVNECHIFIKNICKVSSTDDLITIIKILHEEEIISSSGLMRTFCHRELLWLISALMDEVFSGTKNSKEFNEIFKNLSSSEDYNDTITHLLADRIQCHRHYDDECIVELVNDSNSACLFVFLIAYYSVYKFRFDWDIICVNILTRLWEQHEDFITSEKAIIEMVSRTNASYCISSNSIKSLITYIDASNNMDTLMDVHNRSDLNMFYVFVVKTCIVKQRFNTYEEIIDDKVIIELVNELAKHAEIMKYQYVQDTILFIRYGFFKRIEKYPFGLVKSLRTFILADLKLTNDILREDDEIRYSKALGEYLFVKCRYYDNIAGKEVYIINAFESHNMSVPEYISWIENECAVCNYFLSHLQKMVMEKYLMGLLLKSSATNENE